MRHRSPVFTLFILFYSNPQGACVMTAVRTSTRTIVALFAVLALAVLAFVVSGVASFGSDQASASWHVKQASASWHVKGATVVASASWHVASPSSASWH
jgi:hypothetical protein